MTAFPARPSNPRAPFRLRPTDEELLQTAARYQYVTVEQWCRWYEDPGKRRYLQRRTLALTGEDADGELTGPDYLLRLSISRPGGRRGPSIFTHGLAGRRYVESLGIRAPNRFRRSDLTSLSPQHLAHSEALTDVLLSFDLLARHDPRIRIDDLLHERFLHEQRFKVPARLVDPVSRVIAERHVEVVPDGFVQVVARLGQKERRFPILIEVDRDTEQQAAFRDKIARLLAFGTHPQFERHYGARTFTVAFFLVPPRRDPQTRLAELLDWTERELRQLRADHDAESFSFCARHPVLSAPVDLLEGPQWFHPFETTPHALVDLRVGSEGGA